MREWLMLLVQSKEIKGLSCVGHVAFTGARENYSPLQPYFGPGSVVGIATGYGLDGPGIESR